MNKLKQLEKKLHKKAFPYSRSESIKTAVKNKVGIKEYRVWVSGSSQGHYIVAKNKEEAIIKLRKSDSYFSSKPRFEFRAMLWKTGKQFPQKHTASAIKFRNSDARNKYN